MKKRIQHGPIPGKYSTKALVAITGEHCPINGWWAPATVEEDGRFIAEGTIMPPDKGTSVTWTLIAIESGIRTQNTTPLEASLDGY